MGAWGPVLTLHVLSRHGFNLDSGGSDGTDGCSGGPQSPPGTASSSLQSHTFKFRLSVGVRAFLPTKSTGNVHWGPRFVCQNPGERFINRSGASGAGSPAHSCSAASLSPPGLLTPPFSQHDTQGAKKSGGGFQGSPRSQTAAGKSGTSKEG